MRWPIRSQILLPFSGILLAAVVSVSLLNAYWAAAAAQRQIEDQLRNVGRTLLTSSFPLTEAVLRQMHGLAGAEFVLTAADGHALAASIPLDGALPHPLEIADPAQDLKLGPVVTVGGQAYFQTALRAGRRGAASDAALLHILYPQRILRDAQRQAALPPLLVGVVALVLCVGAANWIARRLSRPIQEVRGQVSRLADGAFQPLPIPQRNDELRDLAASVNLLARQLDESRRAIARSERLSLLGRLSAGLAHHLRNDVAGARMAVQIHARGCAAADAESLDVALRQLTLAEDHLKRFLAAGQPERPRRTRFDVAALLGELAALLQPAARHRQVRLSVASEAYAEIEADREQLRQAAMNLLINAIEAAGEGGWVRAEFRTDDAHRLRVQDSGAGLAADVVERLGEPFTTTKPEGVGLGLAVARQVAEAHGGALAYRRDAGGTCFELSWPLGSGEGGNENEVVATEAAAARLGESAAEETPR